MFIEPDGKILAAPEERKAADLKIELAGTIVLLWSAIRED